MPGPPLTCVVPIPLGNINTPNRPTDFFVFEILDVKKSEEVVLSKRVPNGPKVSGPNAGLPVLDQITLTRSVKPFAETVPSLASTQTLISAVGGRSVPCVVKKVVKSGDAK